VDQSFIKKYLYCIPFLNIQDLDINPLNAELKPIRHLLALAGAHHFVHISRVRVKSAFGTGHSSIRPHFEMKLYYLKGFGLKIHLLTCGKNILQK
jgi:hypothetical protein